MTLDVVPVDEVTVDVYILFLTRTKFGLFHLDRTDSHAVFLN